MSTTTTRLETARGRFGNPSQVIRLEQGGLRLADFWKPFVDAAARLGGAPGRMLDPSKLPESAGRGKRVRFQDGSIYLRPDGGTAWVHGAIGARYDQLGGAEGWLGLPLTDESDFSEGGRVNVFEHGGIYFWPDTGAIDLNEVSIAYSGLLCFGETDTDGDTTPGADEPYVLFGVAEPGGPQTSTRSQVYDDVDAGESRPDRLELFRGQPRGLVVGVTLMEHDFGNPDQFRPQVEEFVTAASSELSKLLLKVPTVGPVLAVGAGAVLVALKSTITDFLNGILGTGDDDLGGHVFALSARDVVLLATRTTPDTYEGVVSKVQSSLLGSNQGASYKVCLTLDAV